MKAVVAAFNQEKALVGAFSVITNLRMQLFEALSSSPAPGLVRWNTCSSSAQYGDAGSRPRLADRELTTAAVMASKLSEICANMD